MAEQGCPEYPAYVPYLSWGQKIKDYRMSREPEVSQSAFAQSIGIQLSRLVQLETDQGEPSYEEHFKFADRWCNGDIESWWVRDQGFGPSTPSQDKRALQDLRRDYKRDKSRMVRYRTLLIQVLNMARATSGRDIGQWLRKVFRAMQELNDMDLMPESMIEMNPDEFLRMTVIREDAPTLRQVRGIINSWNQAWEKATPEQRKVFKGFNEKMKKFGGHDD